MLLSLGCGKLKGLGELLRILNMSKGEMHWDTKHVGNARFPPCLRRMVPDSCHNKVIRNQQYLYPKFLLLS